MRRSYEKLEYERVIWNKQTIEDFLINKNLLLTVIIGFTTHVWATTTPTPHSLLMIY